jgi:hypothetical protein
LTAQEALTRWWDLASNTTWTEGDDRSAVLEVLGELVRKGAIRAQDVSRTSTH